MFFYARKNRWLPLMVCLAGLDAVRGNILSYNSSRRELYLRCPGQQVKGDVLFIGLRRKHDNVPLANWTHSDKGIVTYDRATLGSASPSSFHLLEVVLRYVTCYDVATYMCNMIIRQIGQSSIVNQTEAFTFGGEVMDPVLRADPNQARYRVGDLLQLNCSARTGSASNIFVWETRLPGENFVPVTTGDCDLQTNITAHNPTANNSKSCGVTSESSLTHILTSDDDTREWRCKLTNTGHNAVFVVAVQCLDGTGCSKPCRPVAEQSTQDVTTQQELRASAVKGNVQSDTSLEPQMLIILIAIISVLFVTMLVSIIVMTTMLKKQAKKQLGPLFLTPPPSEYPYTSRARSLPQLPGVMDHYDTTHDDLTRQGGRHGGGEVETRLKLFSPASSSVYVSMSAMPSLHEDPKADHSPRKKPAPEGVPPQFKRSESIYSNGREACDTQTTKISNGSVDSRDDSHVTMGNLKGWM